VIRILVACRQDSPAPGVPDDWLTNAKYRNHVFIYASSMSDSNVTLDMHWGDGLNVRAVLPNPGWAHALDEYVSVRRAELEARDRSRSWFDLATFFMSREIRETVRGDILETRAKMAQQCYHRAWIEAATAVEIARSLGGSWGAVLRDIVSGVIRRILGL
jgi:hypothetical protein